MSKVLKTKQRFVFTVYSNLKRTPPKEFPSVEEMEALVDDVLPALEEGSGKFIEFKNAGEDIVSKVMSGELDDKEGQKQLNDANTEARKYEEKNKDATVDVVFENDPFNKLFQMFERWGKTWFNSVEDFLSVRKDMNETNKQSGKEKEKQNDNK